MIFQRTFNAAFNYSPMVTISIITGACRRVHRGQRVTLLEELIIKYFVEGFFEESNLGCCRLLVFVGFFTERLSRPEVLEMLHRRW